MKLRFVDLLREMSVGSIYVIGRYLGKCCFNLSVLRSGLEYLSFAADGRDLKYDFVLVIFGV